MNKKGARAGGPGRFSEKNTTLGVWRHVVLVQGHTMQSPKKNEVIMAASNHGNAKGPLGNWRVVDVERLIRSLIQMLISLGIALVFAIAVLVALMVIALLILRGDTQATGLLNTVITLVASILTGVIGYVFGQRSSQARQ